MSLVQRSACGTVRAGTGKQNILAGGIPHRRAVACNASASKGESAPLNNMALGLAALATATVAQFAPFQAPAAHALLTAGDPIKSATAILRYALPIDNKPIRQVQRELESINEALRIPGSKSLGPVQRAVRSAESVLSNQRNAIIADFAPSLKEDGLKQLDLLGEALNDFQATIDAKDKQAVPIKQRQALDIVTRIEEDMVKGFSYSVPKEYANLPQLKGRATLEMKVACRDTLDGAKDVTMTIVVDGYNAPISAGNFVDLVQRGFYNGMEIQRSDGFVVQTGDPDGPAEGFVDSSGNVRRIPFEVKVVGDKEPIYDFTLEDLGRYNEQPVLPFNAYGTLAVARAEFDNNSGSSQVFFLLKESELTPTNANLLDGRYAVFGYVVQGQEQLADFKVGDKIQYIKVLSGAENLVNSSA